MSIVKGIVLAVLACLVAAAIVIGIGQIESDLVGHWYHDLRGDSAPAVPQADAASAAQMQNLQGSPLGKALAAEGYLPVVIFLDTHVPGKQFVVYTTCKSDNYTYCAKAYGDNMSATRPGIVVVNDRIVDLLLPKGKDQFYWLRIPSEGGWSKFQLNKAQKAQMLNAMQVVPTRSMGMSSASIKDGPFSLVGVGVTARTNLAPLVQQQLAA